MKPKLHVIVCLAVAILLLTTSCHKEPKNTAATAWMGLHLHTYIGDTLVDPSALNVYVHDSAGRAEKLSHAQFYITNISLHSTTNGWYVIPNSLILKREENEEYPIANVPADNYDDVRFTVGLSAALNSGSPTGYPVTGTDSVLSSIESVMYFGTGLGYKFMSVAGVVDTSANNAGVNVIPFSYDLGATNDTAVITLPVEPFTLQPSANVANNVQFIHIVCDYGHLLQNVPIVTNVGSRAVNTNGTIPQAGSIGAQIWNNILSMFRYECSTPNGNC
jgi:hypothetical protein